ncbi:hypothetical protein Lepto7375DRAFT_0660 [Leptolyngbya sp. PCC 7375]|nr:hypothetical protein Lepto7375DRAFT_0660 [Leptolyngbya sp. PCC 7375]
MSVISISELYPVGAKLFSDAESFLGDLNDDALSNINGGETFTTNSIFCTTKPCGEDFSVFLPTTTGRPIVVMKNGVLSFA